MNCPKCKNQVYVRRVRTLGDAKAYRRNYECPSCGNHFTTYEVCADEMASLAVHVLKQEERNRWRKESV